MELPKQAMSSTQSIHADAAKMIQGLPDQASNDGAVHCMGWMALDGYIDMLMMNYFYHIICLPIDCLYKKILIKRYCVHEYCCNRPHFGPTWQFICLCKKYNLFGVVKNAIEENVAENVNEWKRTVKAQIWHVQNERMNIVCSVNKTLSLIEIPVRSNVILVWWSLVHKRGLISSKNAEPLLGYC